MNSYSWKHDIQETAAAQTERKRNPIDLTLSFSSLAAVIVFIPSFLVTGAGCIRIPILEKKTSFEVFFRK